MGTLGTIPDLKEQSLTYQPLMLAEFAMPDGVTTLRLSTHDLTPPGFQYNGNPYLPRILNQDMAAFQIVSQQGVSIPPTISLKLADADGTMWGYEQSIGFRGATLRIRFVFFQAGTQTPQFSTDWILYGPFLSSAARSVDDTSLVIPAGSKLNMEQIFAPFVHIQQTCPWDFPTTAAQRLDGATNPLSDFWQCGYSPDVSTALAGCGNYQSGTTPFTSCGYPKGDCVARGLYSKDSTGRKTGRFGGMQFQPPTALKSRSYVTGNWQEVYNNLNEAKYGDLGPMVYGMQWVDCPIIVSTGDANMAKFEVLVCVGQVQNLTIGQEAAAGVNSPSGIAMVVLNDTLIPPMVDTTNYDAYISATTGAAAAALQLSPKADQSFCWRVINDGRRSGFANFDTLFSDSGIPGVPGTGLGDPYGSYCAIEIVVPVALATSAAVPRVRVLVQGPAVRVYRTITQIVVAAGVATATLNAVDLVPPTWNKATNVFTISGTGIGGMDQQFTEVIAAWTLGTPGTIQFAATAAAGTYTGLSGLLQYECATTRPPWNLLDVLLWAGWDLVSEVFGQTVSEINIPSFITADTVCGASVSYIDQNGNTQVKDRYKYQFVLRQRRSVAQVVRGILGSMNAIAVPNAAGALTLTIKQTLADQQPAPIPGSNYNTPIASVAGSGGGTQYGYAAYLFNESNVIRDNEGKGKPKFNIDQRPNPDLPALVAVNWQDEDNTFVVDSLTVDDLPSLQRVSQNTTAAAPAEGFANYDQVRRIINTWFAENSHGNPRGDAGGTYQVTLTSTFKGVHLTVGEIALLSWVQKNISRQPFRILQIHPATNFETAEYVLQWHEDAWYRDAYGQSTTPGGNGSVPMLPTRPPYPALLGVENVNPVNQPIESVMELYSNTGWNNQAPDQRTFGIAGPLPINTFSTSLQPPFVPLQGTTSPTGGSFDGGVFYYVGFAAEDSSGGITPLSSLVACYIPAGTNTNTLTVAGIQWPAGTVACHAWCGNAPYLLSYFGRSATVASSFELSAGLGTITSIPAPPPPDQCFQTLQIQVKRIMHPGVWSGAVTSWSASGTGSFTVTGAGWTTNQFAGRTCVVIGWLNTATGADQPDDHSRFTITSNTSDTLTLASIGTPPWGPGDSLYLVIQCLNSGGALPSGIADSGLSLTAGAEVNRIVRIIAGAGQGQVGTIVANDAAGNITIAGTWATLPDSTSVFWIEEAGWSVCSQDIDPGSISALQSGPSSVWHPVDVTGFEQQCLMIEPIAISPTGIEALPVLQSAAIRSFYLFGATGASTSVIQLPPPPSMSISAPGDGSLLIQNITVQTLTGTDTVTAALLVLYSIDQSLAAITFALPAAMNVGDLTMPLVTGTSLPVNTYFLVDSEIIRSGGLNTGGTAYEIERGIGG